MYASYKIKNIAIFTFHWQNTRKMLKFQTKLIVHNKTTQFGRLTETFAIS